MCETGYPIPLIYAKQKASQPIDKDGLRPVSSLYDALMGLLAPDLLEACIAATR